MSLTGLEPYRFELAHVKTDARLPPLTHRFKHLHTEVLHGSRAVIPGTRPALPRVSSNTHSQV